MSPEFFDALSVVLALAIGFLLKKNPKVQNAAIPIINLVIQVLVRVAADIAVPGAEAGVLKDVAKFGENLIVESLIVTVLAGGIQGFNKNTARFFSAVVKELLVKKGLAAAEKEAAKRQPPANEGQ